MAVEAARQTLAEWGAARTAAEAELASLESRSGAEILDDPAAAETLPRVMAELRARIDVAARAIEAQRPRVVAAESAWLSAVAEQYEPAVAEAREVLAKHQERTRALLAQLEEHEGRFVPEHELVEERLSHRAVIGGTNVIDLPKSAELEHRIEVLERPGRILRAMAAGEDPTPMVGAWGLAASEVYPPEVWGPDAVVKAPAYVRQVANAEAEETSLRGALAVAERSVEDLERRIAAGEVAEKAVQDWTLAESAGLPEQLEHAVRHRDGVRERLAALTAR